MLAIGIVLVVALMLCSGVIGYVIYKVGEKQGTITTTTGFIQELNKQGFDLKTAPKGYEHLLPNGSIK